VTLSAFAFLNFSEDTMGTLNVHGDMGIPVGSSDVSQWNFRNLAEREGFYCSHF
jgi:hypothetical protein